MKNSEQFIKIIENLYSNWGSDAPPEAIWVLNDLISWLESEFNISINGRFEEKDLFNEVEDEEDYEENGIYYDNNQRVIKELKSKLK